ncbi:hypothetical protein [Flagellimonas lutaonensis]|uniref:Lipoprotein n=1 Tax=Flagellimonas lutaonensis TaxID=516051 RepID=A0A0D5YWJ8_9FLAO|nr:hypothetical protein [Allomuricauda lutaonensis]AKA36233.1 hypothetical protein VC82_2673 [Allomuricauda lutaonensis]
MRLTKYFIPLLVFIACTEEDDKAPESLEFINSAAVAFAYNGQELDTFFQNPDKAYLSGYLYFEPDLAEDVIFGIDIEWFEGVDNPINFEGADWMALAGFQRNGIFWFRVGALENLSGTPTISENWEIRDINQELEPNTWYKMTIEADFGNREFVSVKLVGGTTDIELDLSGFQLDYPNYIPFDKPSLTYYAFALRSQEFAQGSQGGTDVYFDDLEIGLLQDSGNTVLFNNSFENQDEILEIPFEAPVSPMENITENFWYFENDDAKVSISENYSRTGQKSMLCNADLKK